MKKNVLLSFFVALIVSTIDPAVAMANKAVSATAYRVTDSHVLFLLNFDFGFLNRGAALSYGTNRTTAATKTLQYTIADTKNAPTQITSSGLLLGENMDVKNRYHIVPYGENGNFTLLALADIPMSDAGQYVLTVTDLPYRTIDTTDASAEASYPQTQMANFQATFTE